MSEAFVEENIKENWPHVVAIVTPLNRLAYACCGELGISVVESYKGNGIGKSLMNDVLRRAKDRGLERIELNVFEKNKPAISLYQQLGFVVEGKRKNIVGWKIT